jgi:hypothetical protein
MYLHIKVPRYEYLGANLLTYTKFSSKKPGANFSVAPRISMYATPKTQKVEKLIFRSKTFYCTLYKKHSTYVPSLQKGQLCR